MTTPIRPAEPGDAESIRRIHCAAFPTALEADLVDRLGRDGDLVVSLVAERQGEAVGHVTLSRMKAVGGDKPFRALGLGPVAVDPAMQGSGVGSALVEPQRRSPGRPGKS